MKSNDVYVKRMLDCMAKIDRFTSDMQQTDFLTNEAIQSAVIMQLTLIGELSKKLSTDFKARVDLPWNEIAGFRDVAVHDYYKLDLEDVWLTVQQDLPLLKQTMQKEI